MINKNVYVPMWLILYLCSMIRVLKGGTWVNNSSMKKPYHVHDTVLVINLGGQYAHLIMRRVRELGVYSELVNYNELSRDIIEDIKPKAIILSGGPSNVYDPGAPTIPKWVFDLNIPILGICYGFQLISYLMGGNVTRGKGEFGRTKVKIIEEDPLFNGWGKEEIVWMSHNDHVEVLPEDLELLAISENGYTTAFKHREKPIYGVQFHPEVKHTIKGKVLLRNFLINITGIKPSWHPTDFINDLIEYIRRTVKDKKVLVAVSGGVDSTVTAVLMRKAIGDDKLVPVFINTGLFRENEVNEVLRNLELLGIKPLVVDASEEFLNALKDIDDCEEKRRVISGLYAEILEEIMRKDKDIAWIAQGTTYPDVIESGAVHGSDKIKTHHNVAGLPRTLRSKVIEPLKYFYKDEVRKIGLKLGIPKDMIYRHPFPGPGLAIRVIGRVTKEKLSIVRRASKIVEEELYKAGLYYRVWQAFAVVGDDMWVGVKGDKRAIGRIVIVRIVESEDAMTADWAKIPYDVLDRISRRIVNEIPSVTMVAYSITTKPPSTIEPC